MATPIEGADHIIEALLNLNEARYALVMRRCMTGLPGHERLVYHASISEICCHKTVATAEDETVAAVIDKIMDQIATLIDMGLVKGELT